MSSGLHGEPKILVVGATGKQGQAFIRALTRGPGEPPLFPVRVLALTRYPNSPRALALQKNRPWLELVRGNLDSRDSIKQVFVHAGGKGAIWGMFVVLAFAGLGESTEGEAVQGITLADLALHYGVSMFVYSSVHRGETDDDSELILPEHSGKVKIERHLQSLGEQGLHWTIVRPVQLMETYEGTIGKLSMTVFRAGLKKDVKMRMVAVDDIGLVVALLFQRPIGVAYKILVVTSVDLTIPEQEAAYKRGTGKRMPTYPRILGKFILAINTVTRDVVEYVETLYRHRSDNTELFEEHIANTHAILPASQMITFEEWAARNERRKKRKKRPDDGSDWNRISLAKIFTGRL
ncbi:NAD(P)-binding protein [Cristinia sonorae]|uniref:NAD(P)-binding protein n=1 Tax=Cristinia sonorae TaxID=1940300 RepID=A0A8K0UG22_9AGAR|nr:NAD(P)-binding protein [Cristinia sonorae]